MFYLLFCSPIYCQPCTPFISQVYHHSPPLASLFPLPCLLPSPGYVRFMTHSISGNVCVFSFSRVVSWIKGWWWDFRGLAGSDETHTSMKASDSYHFFTSSGQQTRCIWRLLVTFPCLTITVRLYIYSSFLHPLSHKPSASWRRQHSHCYATRTQKGPPLLPWFST